MGDEPDQSFVREGLTMSASAMSSGGRSAGLWRSLFGSPINFTLTIVFVLLLAATLPFIARWAIIDAAFFPAIPETCETAAGACWRSEEHTSEIQSLMSISYAHF